MLRSALALLLFIALILAGIWVGLSAPSRDPYDFRLRADIRLFICIITGSVLITAGLFGIFFLIFAPADWTWV